MNHRGTSDCVELARTRENGFEAPSFALCTPPTLVNGTARCSDPPTAASWDMTLSEGTWTVSTLLTRGDENANIFVQGGACSVDTNVCTPTWGPPQHADVWWSSPPCLDNGVRSSRVSWLEILDMLGEAILNPDDIPSIMGVPTAPMHRVRATSQGSAVLP